jgi:hypothetical protein
MINDKNKKQEGGDGSSNIQAESVNVYNGITYTDAKEIALDVFNSNFIKLKSEAAQIATERAEEITEKFIKELNEKSPESLAEFNKPALQDALFQTQKEYAKSGDTDLGDLLVDILVDRAKTPERNMLQIVLDESLLVAPKLTNEQLDSLTLNFLLIQTKRNNIVNLESFKKYLDDIISKFIENFTDERTSYNHIEYLGCGHVRAGDYGQLENNLKTTYKAIFSKGFSKEEFEEKVGDFSTLSNFTMPCLHDKAKFQIRALSDDVLDQEMDKHNLDESLRPKLKQLFNTSTMSNQEVKDYIISINPSMEKIFDVWKNSVFNKLELSSVGIAIAHANYRRKTDATMDLSIWIK